MALDHRPYIPYRYCRACGHTLGKIQHDTDMFPCRNPKCDFYGVVQVGVKHTSVLQAEWEQQHPGCTRIVRTAIRHGRITPV